MKKILVIFMVLLFLGFPAFLGALSQYRVDEVVDVVELKEMFPDMYFFDFGIEILRMGAMRDNSTFVGCSENRKDYHGYQIEGTRNILLLEKSVNLWMAVYSNLRFFGEPPEFCCTYDIIVVDGVSINIYIQAGFIWFIFSLYEVQYFIEIGATSIIDDNVDDFIVMFQTEVLTPAIVGRKLGGDS